MFRKEIIKGRFYLPLIIILFVLLIGLGAGKVLSSHITTQSVGIVDLQALLEVHPLTTRINQLEKRIDDYKDIYRSEARLDNLEAKILAEVKKFGEYSYDRAEFIVANYNKQIERQETIIQQRIDNLAQDLDHQLQTDLEEKKEELTGQLRKTIAEKEDYYVTKAKDYKQEITKNYSKEISNLQLSLKFSSLSELEREKRQERLAELKEQKSREITIINDEYDDKLKEFIAKKEDELADKIATYEQQLEELYNEKYKTKKEEIKLEKEDDIKVLEDRLAKELEEEPLAVEEDAISVDLFATDIISLLREKNSQNNENLESLRQQRDRLKRERKAEINSLIERHSQRNSIDLVLSNKLPGISVTDLTAEIKEEFSIYH